MRNHDLKNMQNLQNLDLDFNRITSIDSDSFKDLVSLKMLSLSRNLIETLEFNIFASMVSLKSVYLGNNKIKILSSKTFEIPGGKLDYVDLESNVCINGLYHSEGWDRLKTEIKEKCKM